MDRYLLFGGDYYYASGGANDLIDVSDNRSKLINDLFSGIYKDQWGNVLDPDWWHIYDTERSEIVNGSKQQAHGANDLDEDKVINRSIK